MSTHINVNINISVHTCKRINVYTSCWYDNPHIHPMYIHLIMDIFSIDLLVYDYLMALPPLWICPCSNHWPSVTTMLVCSSLLTVVGLSLIIQQLITLHHYMKTHLCPYTHHRLSLLNMTNEAWIPSTAPQPTKLTRLPLTRFYQLRGFAMWEDHGGPCARGPCPNGRPYQSPTHKWRKNYFIITTGRCFINNCHGYWSTDVYTPLQTMVSQ